MILKLTCTSANQLLDLLARLRSQRGCSVVTARSGGTPAQIVILWFAAVRCAMCLVRREQLGYQALIQQVASGC